MLAAPSNRLSNQILTGCPEPRHSIYAVTPVLCTSLCRQCKLLYVLVVLHAVMTVMTVNERTKRPVDMQPFPKRQLFYTPSLPCPSFSASPWIKLPANSPTAPTISCSTPSSPQKCPADATSMPSNSDPGAEPSRVAQLRAL